MNYYFKIGDKLLLVLLLILCIPCFSLAQNEFQHTYGGSLINEGRSVQQTLDGGYIIAGSTSSFGYGATDVLLIKTDSAGKAQFMKTYGGSNVDIGYSVLQLSDSGYIIAGYTNSFGNGGYDAYLVRTDKNGDTLWTKTYGGADWDFVYSCKQTSDGGFVMAGNTYSYGNGNSNGWIIKTDSIGDTLWTKVFLTNDDDYLSSIDLGFNNSYITAGYGSNLINDSNTIIAANISSTGDSLWFHSYPDTLNREARVVHSLRDSTYLIGGAVLVDSNQTNSFLVKLDTNGHQLWVSDTIRDYTGINDLYDFVELPNHNLVIAETTTAFSAGGIDVYQEFTDSVGNWYNGPTDGGAGNEFAYSISRTADNGFVMVGETNTWGPGLKAVYLIKTDSAGHTTNNMHVIIGIDTYIINGEYIKIFPNPAQSEVTIDLTQFYISMSNLKVNFQLFNSLGEMVSETFIRENKRTLPLKNLSSGLYFYCISGNGNIYSKGKLVIEE